MHVLDIGGPAATFAVCTIPSCLRRVQSVSYGQLAMVTNRHAAVHCSVGPQLYVQAR